MNVVNDVQLISLRSFKDDGYLVPIEENKEIPFKIARVFYVYGVTPGAVRGHHAHYECHQAFICLRGKCEVVCDDGKSLKTFLLESPAHALHVPPGIWATEKYVSSETILLALTDQKYDPKDYIKDHEEFVKWRSSK